MGRYQGTWRRKEVIKLAPDLLVYINGKLNAAVGQGVEPNEINNLVLSFGSSCSVDGGPSTAHLELFDARHMRNPWYKARQVSPFGLMSEIEVYAKGRFKSLREGTSEPTWQYYPIFWGLVTNISRGYSRGEHTFSIDCKDMLHWWEIMTFNVNPSVYDVQHLPMSYQALGNYFIGMNPFEIIYSLTKVVIQNFPADYLFTQGIEDNKSASEAEGAFIRNVDVQATAMMDYWRYRFNSIAKALKMFGAVGDLQGTNPSTVIAEDSVIKDRSYKSCISGWGGTGASLFGRQGYSPSLQRPINIPRVMMDTAYIKANVRPFGEYKSGGELTQGDNRTLLSIVGDVKKFMGYEFYQDTCGEIIFKPPFFNMDVKNCMLYCLEDEDIKSWGIDENESQILATKMTVFGIFNVPLQSEQDAMFVPHGTYIDYKLAREFGIRVEQRQIPTQDAASCFAYAVSEMDISNSKRFSSSVSILARPELRLGYPIYLASQDAYYYIRNIAHSYSIEGMSAETTLTLDTLRSRHVSDAYYSLVSDGKLEEAKAEILKDRVLKFQEAPVVASEAGSAPAGSVKRDSSTKPRAVSDATLTGPPDDADTKVLREQWQRSQAIVETKPGTWVETTHVGLIAFDIENQELPVSDQDGYEVFGALPYGRTLMLDEAGIMKMRSGPLPGDPGQGGEAEAVNKQRILVAEDRQTYPTLDRSGSQKNPGGITEEGSSK